ncbi:MAG: D-alanyl-D-alanine carboxypeptidase family protein [Clostridia bacterium]
MKRLLFTLMFLFLFFTEVAYAQNVEISAKSAVVIDSGSGRVLFEKDAYIPLPMASTTKIMTGLLAVEMLNLNDIVTVSAHASGTEGSSVWLETGEHISSYDLLYGLMLSSGNDAAVALAEHIAGSVDAFTVLMNKRAKEIGANNTNFTNPHGLPDDNHYTTAYDLARISRIAMNNKTFREVVSTKNKTISWENSQWNRSLTNHNKLLKMYDYAIGIKTGYTKKAGRCLASAAKKDGRELIIVTLSDPDDWNDHIRLYNYCFDTYLPYTLCKKGENVLCYKPKSKGAESIDITYGEDYVASLSEEEEKNITRKLKLNITFPVSPNQKVGECELYYYNEKIGSVSLLAKNESYPDRGLPDIIKQLMKGIILQ